MYGRMFEMTHYHWTTKDGLVHVQNAVGVMMGQHHVHTTQNFARWSKTVSKEALKRLDAEVTFKCDCGLSAGQMKADASIWT